MNPTPERSHNVDPACRAGLILACLTSILSFLLIFLVRGYQVGLRPLLIGSCKFCPTCSNYFIVAVHKHGPFRGGWLGLRRLLRCHPFGPGGYDPVP